jgi:hypothetical protein
MYYADAREVIYASGLTFLYYDFYDRDEPSGVIMYQDPAAGSVVPKDSLIVLYRVFKAPLMWVGASCRELILKGTTGRLTFAVHLEQDEIYTIRTDFQQGETIIFDYRMMLMTSFENRSRDSTEFVPEWTGWYVITLGPYEIGQSELDQWPEGVPAGCLWVLPPEG